MKEKDVLLEFREMTLSVQNNSDLKVVDSYTPPRLKKSKVSAFKKKGIDYESLFLFFQEIDGFVFKWKLKEEEENDISGHINIQDAKSTFGKWENTVYFKDTPKDDRSRNFKIIDFFIDEACVGFFHDDQEEKQLYFFDFENHFYPLNVDFDGYIQLLIMARGFFYWQKALIDFQSGKETPMTKHFKKQMPKLFPDFKFEDFEKLYNDVRLEK